MGRDPQVGPGTLRVGRDSRPTIWKDIIMVMTSVNFPTNTMGHYNDYCTIALTSDLFKNKGSY